MTVIHARLIPLIISANFLSILLIIKTKWNEFKYKFLKSYSHLPKQFFFIYFNDSPSKIMKNAFYFILKALFVLKIFKFLSWDFGHVEKTVWLEG